MALWIPRLEWDEVSVTATRTATSPVLSSIASTAEINVGMIVNGTGLPTDAVVVSKTVSTVTLNVDATLSGSSVLVFKERYDFEFPPVSDSEEILKPKLSVIESLSGLQQFQVSYLEAERNLDFFFINQTDADKLKDNFYIYAYLGNSFKYYQDKDDAGYQTMTLNKYDFSRTRQVKKHPYFKYSIKFSFRRVV